MIAQRTTSSLREGRSQGGRIGLKPSRRYAVPAGTRFHFNLLPSVETLGYDMPPLRGWRTPNLRECRALRVPTLSPEEGGKGGAPSPNN